jgi:hypothetical protein
MPSQRLLDIIADPIHLHTTIRLHTSRIGPPWTACNQASGSTEVGRGGQAGQDGMCQARWLIPTTATLMGTLRVVVVHKCLGDAANFFEGSGTMHQQTFFFVGSMVSLHVAIEFWMARRQDVGLDANTEQKLTQGRRKIACRRTAHPSGIPIEGQHGGEAITTQERDHRLESRFC